MPPMPSDPAKMTPLQVKRFVAAGGLPRLQRGFTELLAPRVGAPAWGWPDSVLRQTGFGCTAMALVNGIRCHQAVQGSPLWNPSAEDVLALRQAAAAHASTDSAAPVDALGGAIDHDSVASLLAAQGFLRPRLRSVTANPLAVASALADHGGFAVRLDGTDWHATTIVPNVCGFSMSDGTTPELLVLDSLSGATSGLRSDELCRYLAVDEDVANGDITTVYQALPGTWERWTG